MAVNTNSQLLSPERSFALQKYLLLHSQNDAIQRRLSESQCLESYSFPNYANASRSRNSSLSSIASSHSHSRTLSHSFPISPIHEESSLDVSYARPPLNRSRRSSLPLPFTEISTPISKIEDDEQQLLNVNQQIKTVLTELLNCEGVKHDRAYRMWIQEKLMDAEKELKGCKLRSGRRRSSCTSMGS